MWAFNAQLMKCPKTDFVSSVRHHCSVLYCLCCGLTQLPECHHGKDWLCKWQVSGACITCVFSLVFLSSTNMHFLFLREYVYLLSLCVLAFAQTCVLFECLGFFQLLMPWKRLVSPFPAAGCSQRCCGCGVGSVQERGQVRYEQTPLCSSSVPSGRALGVSSGNLVWILTS